jgi:hypothetical protein
MSSGESAPRGPQNPLRLRVRPETSDLPQTPGRGQPDSCPRCPSTGGWGGSETGYPGDPRNLTTPKPCVSLYGIFSLPPPPSPTL